MKIALCQLDLAWEQREENWRRAERRIQEAAALGAELVILPEMFCCGFSMAAARLAEPEEGPTLGFLREVAEGLGVAIIAGLPERGAAGGMAANRAVLVGAGGVRRYQKLHPFRFAGEQEHYAAGQEICAWPIRGRGGEVVRVTPFICYDLRFPEVFRAAAAETDLFVVIANWPERRRQHWQTLARARAIENLCYVAAVNRVGEGGGLTYAGDSAIHDPWGELLAGAAVQEAVLVAEIDPARVAETRRAFPALEDRRF